VVSPDPKHPTFRGRVAVLMGPANMSSCESFLLMMKQVPHCKLIGRRSYGSSGNPQPVALANGVTVYLPSWRDLLPDGACFEGHGIEPDIEVKAQAQSSASSDEVLETALRELRRPTAGRTSSGP
ncbi:MAG: S41 family peptidase, partial [Candidatus Saccharimonadales bacterium]